MRGKKAIIIVIIAAVIIAANLTYLNPFADVTLIYEQDANEIGISPSKIEALKLKQILNLNFYEQNTVAPSCGFYETVRIEVGKAEFAAGRGCGTIENMSNGKYFTVSPPQLDYIHGLIEKYGGQFQNI